MNRQTLHQRTHSLLSALLAAALAAHDVHAHFLSGSDDQAIGHLTAVMTNLDIAIKDRRDLHRLIKKGIPEPASRADDLLELALQALNAVPRTPIPGCHHDTLDVIKRLETHLAPKGGDQI